MTMHLAKDSIDLGIVADPDGNWVEFVQMG